MMDSVRDPNMLFHPLRRVSLGRWEFRSSPVDLGVVENEERASFLKVTL